MKNRTDPLTSSDLIGSEQERTQANSPPCGSKLYTHALSTVDRDGPRAAAASPSAIRPAPGSDALLAAMGSHTATPIASDPVCIDEQELSRRTTLSRTTLQTMRRQGGGPPFAKLGHRIVYRLADVERWIAERTRYAQPTPTEDTASTQGDTA
ncbi:MAG TPA: helix-turn-helix domain-containing protein [Kofleriaceae bacterium]